MSLYDYRGRSNLLLFFSAAQRTAPICCYFFGRTKDRADSHPLGALAKRYGEIAETNSEVVVVLAESVAHADEFRQKMRFPVSVLSDPDMRIH